MKDGPMMHAIYTCEACGIMDRVMVVPAREVGQGLVEWLNAAVHPVIVRDHKALSPNCTSTRVGIKMPVPDGTTQLGTPPLQ